MFPLKSAFLALLLVIKATALAISGDKPTDNIKDGKLICAWDYRITHTIYYFQGENYGCHELEAIDKIWRGAKNTGLVTGWEAAYYPEDGSRGDFDVNASSSHLWCYCFLPGAVAVASA
jgi:hypothetical protein